MRNNLFICFLFTISLSFSQSEREVINQIDSINKSALNYYNTNDLMQSINSFNEAIKLSDSINDSYGNAIANFSLGKIYNHMQEYNDAERCYKKMLAESQEIDDNYLIANAYLSLGGIYRNKKQIANVIPYFEKALLYAQKKQVKDQNNVDAQQNVLFKIRMSLCEAYLDLKEPDEGLLYLLRAGNHLENATFNAYNKGLFSFMYGRYFSQRELFLQANDKFNEAVTILGNDIHAEELNNIELISKVYKEQSMAFALLGNSDEAYTVLLKHNLFREKILNEEKIKQENIAKSKLHNAEYKRVARLANNERFLQEQVAYKMQKINWVITLGIILLLVSCIAIYKNYLSKRKLSNTLEARNKQL